MKIRQHFTEHPASVGETYGEHFRVAAGFSGSLAMAAMAAAVHALVPSRCPKSASRRVIEMHERMTTGARAGTIGDTGDTGDTSDPGADQPSDDCSVVAA